LTAVLRATDPATEVWTWSPQQHAGWVRRRMAHETAVHRWDAQEAAAEAAGRPEPIDPAIAADGVDEFLEFFLDSSPERLAGGDASLHLHSTAPEAEWTIRIADGDLVVDRAHAKADAAIRAPASDLVLALWRRIPVTELERFGDDRTIQRFLSLADRA
jgi:hypothetical protein